MELAQHFLPTAGAVGMLPMLTWFFMLVAFYAFVGSFLFALTSRNSVAPEHAISRNYTAIIAAVAGISYWLIQGYYRDMLTDLAKLNSEAARQMLIRQSYNAIGQLRYFDWAITTPLLLLKIASMVKVHYREHRTLINTMLIADLFMIVTGYVGEQQLTADNQVLDGPKLVWGAISTVGYVVVAAVLWRIWRQFAQSDSILPEERSAFKIMALLTVTLWGVYPIGYVLTTIDSVDLNWVHLSFSIADIINKVGVGALAFQTAEQVLERRVAEDANAPYRSIS